MSTVDGMRRSVTLLVAATLLAGCGRAADDEPASGPPATGDPATSIGPEDTLPVLGLWVSAPDAELERRWLLTLSDDDTYTLTDECNEVPGRWDLAGGRVILTPDADGGVACTRWSAEIPELGREFTVEADALVPSDGVTFVRPD